MTEITGSFTEQEVTMNDYFSALESLKEEILNVRQYENKNEARWRFNFLYVGYRAFVKIINELTPEFTNEQWDEIEQIRNECERLRKLYGDKHNIRDIEP